MITDALCDAISEIDRYLTDDAFHGAYHDKDGNPDPEIVRLREHMRLILIDLNIPDGISPEIDADKAERMAAIREKFNL
jgi:hypothetical protein